jgi:hypothetical protein
MKTSALARAVGGGVVLLAFGLAGLQGACVHRTARATVGEADASSIQDAMLAGDLADSDSAGIPSDLDADGAVANDDTTLDEANASDGGLANDAALDDENQAPRIDGGDAPPDAGEDADSATDCSSLTPTECLLELRRGPECRTCAQSQCAAPSLQCEHLAGQAAMSGPALGQSRQDLCLASLSCILTSKCYLFGAGVDACYCGSEGRSACSDGGLAPNAKQFCLSAEQNGLETTDPGAALGSLTDKSLGAGTANAMELCLERNCIKCL